MDKKKDLQSLLEIYKILKTDDSEFNLYNNSKTLDKLIEKAQNDLEELENEWWQEQRRRKKPQEKSI